MALIIEDGTGKPDADSYVSTTDADAFWSSRGEAAWAAASQTDKEIALRRAFDYLALAYSWPGQPLQTDQSGCWPRAGGYDADGNAIASDATPLQVKNAQILLGLEALAVNICKNVESDPALVRKTVGVGSLASSKEWDPSLTPKGFPRFIGPDHALRKIGKPRGSGGAGVTRLLRA